MAVFTRDTERGHVWTSAAFLLEGANTQHACAFWYLLLPIHHVTLVYPDLSGQVTATRPLIAVFAKVYTQEFPMALS